MNAELFQACILRQARLISPSKACWRNEAIRDSQAHPHFDV